MIGRKCIAVAAIVTLLSIAVAAAWASFPNTYNNSVIAVSYNPSNDTVSWTEHWTGTTQAGYMPSNVYHTPRGVVHLGSNGSGIWYGQQTQANAQMNQSHTFSLPPLSVNCPSLADAQCFGDTQPDVYCPIAGSIVTWWKKIQFQIAWTYTKPVDPECYPGTCIAQVNCTTETSPPDYQGPFNTQNDNYPYLYHAIMYRTTTWGSSFTNQPWKYLWELDPPQNLYLDNSPHTCTKLDAGYPSNPGGPPTPH